MVAALCALMVGGSVWLVTWIVMDCIEDVRYWREHPPRRCHD